MSPLVAYHATNPKCRESILRRGLLPAQPQKGRPFGVYVFRDDDAFNHPTFSRGGRLIWVVGGGQDIWEAAYIGPLTPDQYVINGMVFLGPVHHVTLVTGNGE